MSAINKFKILKNEDFRLGAWKVSNGYAFAFVSEAEKVNLVIFTETAIKPEYTIELDSQYKTGNVFSVFLKDINIDGYSYIYEVDGELITDPYAKILTGLSEFGVKDETGLFKVHGKLTERSYNWKNDKKPGIRPEDMIIYKLHPRGFTMSPSSKCKYPGTFKGITEKINYLKGLGINVVELMPAYEFNEYEYKFSYWGYNKGLYFVPKAAYTSIYGRTEDYTSEFKDMVKKFHNSGIEVIMEFYFPPETPSYVILDCLKFWKKEYHIDGAHLICDERVRFCLADEPYLKDVKLIYTNWQTDMSGDNLYEYNEGFMNVARKLLKGDEDQLEAFTDKFKSNPAHAHVINYVADNNGFTLMDLVSYERKHNEDNGEGNRDVKDYNISWNCGEEGPSKSRRIRSMRLQNRKNAVMMLLLAQGIPLIYAGDEFGNSQNGNNNPYCQDNEVGWTDWSAMGSNKKYTEFVKEIISFRKAHKILHTEKQLFQNDYKYYGLPDISFHGTKAWYPELDYYNRHMGIMLCGKYAGDEEDIYIAFNLHWETHNLALPKVPGKIWNVYVCSGDAEAVINEDDRSIEVPPRSIVILTNEKNG